VNGTRPGFNPALLRQTEGAPVEMDTVMVGSVALVVVLVRSVRDARFWAYALWHDLGMSVGAR
jgi:hypothetical protein